MSARSPRQPPMHSNASKTALVSGLPSENTAKRKDEHLDLCATDEVVPLENSTLFHEVHLIHCALPEMGFGDVELRRELFGKTLQAPLLVTGMTGGTERAKHVNLDVARAAEELQIAFGVGSQRAMVVDPSTAHTFRVREVAPTVTLIGNIGLVQAVQMGADAALRLKDALDADALAVHLNPGQELTQPEGDRDFSGGLKLLESLAKRLGDRLLVKETGCGLSAQVLRRLTEIGVTQFDVSGLGGTSWVRVEALRQKPDSAAKSVGEQFSTWGIPTAAAVAAGRQALGPGPTLIASGGMRNGLDVAKALALGADLGGMALPVFQAQQRGGSDAVVTFLKTVLVALKTAMLLTGSRNVTQLRQRPVVLGESLIRWKRALLEF